MNIIQMKNLMKIISFTLSIWFLINLMGCKPKLDVEHAQLLKEEIYEVARTEKQFELKELTNFEWDTVFIFPPYTSFNKINSLTKTNWDGLKKTSIDDDDEFCLLLFKNNGELVKYLMQPRGMGDFSRIGISSFDRKNAVFDITTKEQTNSLWYYIENVDD